MSTLGKAFIAGVVAFHRGLAHRARDGRDAGQRWHLDIRWQEHHDVTDENHADAR
jgi:hypothetical protein